jgi:hypothetical protein
LKRHFKNHLWVKTGLCVLFLASASGLGRAATFFWNGGGMIFNPHGHVRRLAAIVAFLALFTLVGTWQADAALTLTVATNGSAISADTTGGSYTTLTGPKLTESTKKQIGIGTIILNVPSGFMFNTGAVVTVTNTGNIILSNTTAVVTATNVTIGVKTRSTSKSTLTWTGIQIRPTAGTPLASGIIINSGSSGGPANPGNWGTLTEVAGAASKLAFGTQPSSVGYGQPITPAVTVKILDQYGNLKTNSNASVTIAIGSNPASGTLSGTTTVTATNGIATFSTLSINNIGNGYTLTANASGLTGVTSIAFNINPYRYAVASGSWTNTAIWSGSSGGTPGASVPVAGDTVFIGEAVTSYTVSIPNGYGAACGAVTMGNLAGTNASTLALTNASSSLTVGGNVTMNRPNAGATTTISIGAGSLTVNGTLELAHHTNSNTANNLINTVTISTGSLTIGGDLIFGAEDTGGLQSQIVFNGAGTMNLAGAFTLSNNKGTLTPSTGTVNFNGSTAGQAIPIGVSSVTYSNLTINNTSGSGATLGAAITGTLVTGNLSVQSGTFNNGGFAIALASGRNFSVSNGASFNLAGTSTMVAVSGGGTKVFGTNSTVNYAGANQTVTAETYGNLTLSGSVTKTMPASTTTVAGNFTLADGSSVSATAGAAINTAGDVTLGSGTTFNAGAFTHSVGGDWFNNGATFSPGTGTINLNGTSGSQNLWGSADTTFNNLIVNNSAGVLLGANPTVNGTLTLTSGILTTASYQINVANTSNAAIAGAGGSNYINGTLQKNFATGSGQSFTFPIGGPDYYRPIGLTNLNVTTAGALMAQVTGPGAHPNIGTSGINPNRNVNQYWTLTDDGVLVVGNYNPTFNFVAGDVDAGADTTQFVVRRFDGTNWSATATGIRTSTNTAATGLSVIGDCDFVVGDPQASQMMVTLPGQTFTSGTGNAGTVTAQVAGTAFNLTLSAVDIFNAVDTTYTGTQTINYAGPANAPNGAAPVYTTSVTFSSGQATAVATTLKKAETTAITATDGTLTGVTSSNVTVNPVATRLVYTTVPATGTAGTAFSVTVQSQDANGNPASPTSNTTITLSKASGGGSLSGTLTGNILSSGNSVTIATAVYSKSDTLTLTATATAGMTSLTSATSGNIVFSAGTATKLVYTTVPTNGTVGAPFSVTVQSQDANGNPASPTSNTTITLSQASGGGSLSGTLTGSILTSGNSVTIATPIYSKSDTMTLKATATAGMTSLASVTSGSIVFSASMAAKLAYTTVPSTGTAGTAFTVIVQSQDTNGNPATLTNATTVTLSKATGGGSLSGTLTGIIASGANSVTIATPVYSKSDTLTLTATASGGMPLTAVTSGNIVFSAGAASRLVFSTQPGSAAAGAIFGSQPALITQDAFGNNSTFGLANSLNVTMALNSGSGPLQGTTNIDIGTGAGNGTATFTDLRIDSVGTKQLIASAAGLTSGVSSNFTVAQGSQTITFGSLSNKTYGAAPFTASASASSGLPVAFSILSGPASVVSSNVTITGAGTVTVRASQTGDANFLSATPIDQSFTVAKAVLTVTASNQSRVFGATNPVLTASYSGFVNGESSGVLSGAPALSTTATTASSVAGSPYAITVTNGTLSATNYSFGFVNGQMTITAASSALAVSTSANPSPTGSNVTFTATVTAVSPGSGTPTGTIQFLADGLALGSPTFMSGGIAGVTSASLAHGSHTITARYTGDGNFFGSTNNLSPNQVINSQPVAVTDQVQRYVNTGVKVRPATLLANDNDPEGDALTLVSVSSNSVAGGVVSMQSGWIDYQPPAGFTNADSYSYIMADSGGLQATGTVSVVILVDGAQSQNVGGIDNLGNGSSRIHFSGLPGRTYPVQYATNLVTPVWLPLGTATADASGKFEFTDSPATNSPPRFYRSTYP